jgi:hypothetical protein
LRAEEHTCTIDPVVLPHVWSYFMKRMLVTACLVLALAGCGGNEEGPAPNVPLPTPTSAAPTVQPDSPGGTITDLPTDAVPGQTATD